MTSSPITLLITTIITPSCISPHLAGIRGDMTIGNCRSLNYMNGIWEIKMYSKILILGVWMNYVLRPHYQIFCDVAVTVKFYYKCDVAKSFKMGPKNCMQPNLFVKECFLSSILALRIAFAVNSENNRHESCLKYSSRLSPFFRRTCLLQNTPTIQTAKISGLMCLCSMKYFIYVARRPDFSSSPSAWAFPC